MLTNSPEIYSFSFGNIFWVGASERALRKFYSAKKGDFVFFEDGEMRCLRCGELDTVRTLIISLPQFFFIWNKDLLAWKPVWAWQRRCIETQRCSQCDPLLNVECQAVICFRECVPENLLREKKSLLEQK